MKQRIILKKSDLKLVKRPVNRDATRFNFFMESA